jgi:hypothetical protein
MEPRTYARKTEVFKVYDQNDLRLLILLVVVFGLLTAFYLP